MVPPVYITKIVRASIMFFSSVHVQAWEFSTKTRFASTSSQFTMAAANAEIKDKTSQRAVDAAVSKLRRRSLPIFP